MNKVSDQACNAFIETSLANGHDCGFTEPCDALRSAILAAHSADARNGEGVALTDGYALVPLVPTAAMIEAWNNSGADDFKISDPNYSEFTDQEWSVWKETNATKDWQAMVRAAPAAPASESEYAEGMENAAQIADDVCARSRNHLFRSAAKIIAGSIRESAPKSIFLIVGEGLEGDETFDQLDGVTWCADSQFDSDIEYVRADIAAPAPAAPAPKHWQSHDDGLVSRVEPAPAAQADDSAWLALEQEFKDRYQVVRDGYWWQVKIGTGTERIGKFYKKTEAERLVLQLSRAFNEGIFVATKRQQSATPADCTCPSGNGSLRHPCPVLAVEPVADPLEGWTFERTNHPAWLVTEPDDKQWLCFPWSVEYRLVELVATSLFSTPADAAIQHEQSLSKPQ